MFSKPNVQGVKWFIDDNFLRFWFRFIESNRSMIELGKYDLLREYLDRHYDQFSGIALEKYFREKAKHVLPYLKGYEVEYRGYSIEDM